MGLFCNLNHRITSNLCNEVSRGHVRAIQIVFQANSNFAMFYFEM